MDDPGQGCVFLISIFSIIVILIIHWRKLSSVYLMAPKLQVWFSYYWTGLGFRGLGPPFGFRSEGFRNILAEVQEAIK